MGHGHHDHHHHHTSAGQNLKVAFLLNLMFTVLEIVGGLYVNSVAIISDAIHDLGDSLSLGTAWFLENKSKKGSDRNFSFGYARFSLLGALINSVVLVVGSAFVIYEAIQRIQHPEQANAEGMIVFAIIGIVVNGYAAWKLLGGHSLNERVVAWHLLEDVLGWVAVLIAAIIMYFIDIPIIDPILSLLITVYILYGVSKRLKETLFIFLQGVPDGYNVEDIENEILTIDQVSSIHDTHIWSLEGEKHVFTTHLKLKNVTSVSEIKTVKIAVKSILKKYHFDTYTIETEVDGEVCEMESKVQG